MNGDRVGLTHEIESSVTVNAGPGVCPFENRQLFTAKSPPDDEIRAVSYNLLADLYADSDYSRTILHPQCPPYALAFDYRKQLIVKELLGYNSDILCLQEVDRKFFKYDLNLILDIEGFGGEFETKGDESAEGVSIFYRKSKFKLVSKEVITLAESIENDPQLICLKETIGKNESLKESIMGKKTILLTVVLESVNDPNKILVVGVTHLYFKPTADHIRLLQTEICLNKFKQLMQKYQGKKIMKTCSEAYV